MEMLQKIFPLSFKRTDSLGSLIIGILIYIVVGALAGFAIGLLWVVPVVNLVIGLVGGLIDIYVVAGIVIQILVYMNILK